MGFWSSVGSASVASVVSVAKDIQNDSAINAAVSQAFAAADDEVILANESLIMQNRKMSSMKPADAVFPFLSASLVRVVPAIQLTQHALLETALKTASMWKLEGKNGWYSFYVKNGLQGQAWCGVISNVNYPDAMARIASWRVQPALPGTTWRLPSYQELYAYAYHAACPHRSGQPYRLGGQYNFW